jgi:hypothetical protein
MCKLWWNGTIDGRRKPKKVEIIKSDEITSKRDEK